MCIAVLNTEENVYHRRYSIRFVPFVLTTERNFSPARIIPGLINTINVDTVPCIRVSICVSVILFLVKFLSCQCNI